MKKIAILVATLVITSCATNPNSPWHGTPGEVTVRVFKEAIPSASTEVTIKVTATHSRNQKIDLLNFKSKTGYKNHRR